MLNTTNEREKVAEEISDYISELKKIGLEISLCDLDKIFYVGGKSLLSFNGHTCAYCMAVKGLKGLFRKCLERQAALKNDLEQGRLSVCYAGVAEYVFPIVYNERYYGLIFAGATAAGEIGPEVVSAAGVDRARLEKLYHSSFSGNLFSKKQIDAFVNPLLRMLSVFLEKNSQLLTDAQDELYFAAVKYLEERYAEKISLAELAQKLGYSQSYVCRIFKKKSGKTVFAFLEWMRLKKAEELLRTTGLSVTEIAYCTGYSDSNYFSNTFKKAEGCSPSAYRKRKESRADR